MAARIVVVDDDPDIAEMLTMILEDEGYVVELASDGTLALALIEREHPALIVADLVMPNVDGAELAQRVAALPGPSIPVLLTSASRLPALPPGVAFLPKPFELSDLLDQVRALAGPP